MRLRVQEGLPDLFDETPELSPDLSGENAGGVDAFCLDQFRDGFGFAQIDFVVEKRPFAELPGI